MLMNLKRLHDAVKSEFAEWCDSSKCVFAKVDDNNLIELFFDVNPPKLKAWLGKESTQEMFKSTALHLQDTRSRLFKCKNCIYKKIAGSPFYEIKPFTL